MDVYKAIKVGVILFKVILATNLYKSVSQMVLSKRTQLNDLTFLRIVDDLRNDSLTLHFEGGEVDQVALWLLYLMKQRREMGVHNLGTSPIQPRRLDQKQKESV